MYIQSTLCLSEHYRYVRGKIMMWVKLPLQARDWSGVGE